MGNLLRFGFEFTFPWVTISINIISEMSITWLFFGTSLCGCLIDQEIPFKTTFRKINKI
jgi:hypothetical protein